MSNVINSTSNAAQNCVDLPADLMAQKLVVIYLFFRQWTGTVSMSRADYLVGADGSLPPEAVAANYGQKRVIDPFHLRTFDALKKRADTLLADVGLPFCKGTVIPIDKAPEVVKALNDLAVEYNQKRDQFVKELPLRFQEWMQQNPEFSGRIPAPSQTDIANRINADFSVFQFQPLAPDIDATGSLKRTVNGLFGEVIHDVAKRSLLLLRRSVCGKTADDLSQRTLSALKVLKKKLESLEFVNTGVRPIGELVARVLSIMPTKGKFSTDQYNALYAALGLLSNEGLLLEVARGDLTLDQHFSRNLVAVTLPASDASLFDSGSTSAPKAAASAVIQIPEAIQESGRAGNIENTKEDACASSVPHASSEAEPHQAASATAEVPAAPASLALEETTRVNEAVSAVIDDDRSTASETESEAPLKAFAESEADASASEAKSKDNADDLDALLASFFDEDSFDPSGVEKPAEAQESEPSAMQNQPPAPKAIHLSAF